MGLDRQNKISQLLIQIVTFYEPVLFTISISWPKKHTHTQGVNCLMHGMKIHKCAISTVICKIHKIGPSKIIQVAIQ